MIRPPEAVLSKSVVADPAQSSTEALTGLARARLDDVPVLAEQLMAAIFTDNPEWTDYSPVPREDLWEGCKNYLRRILEILCGEVSGPARMACTPRARSKDRHPGMIVARSGTGSAKTVLPNAPQMECCLRAAPRTIKTSTRSPFISFTCV